MPSKAELELRKKRIQAEREGQLEAPPKDDGTAVDSTLKQMFFSEQKKEVVEKPKKQNLPQKKHKEGSERNTQVSFKYFDESDKDFLLYGKNINNCETKEEFFIKLIEKESKKEVINPYDEMHKDIKSSTMILSGNVRTSPEIIKVIKERQGMHHMNKQQYIAYVIHSARLNTDGWN